MIRAVVQLLPLIQPLHSEQLSIHREELAVVLQRRLLPAKELQRPLQLLLPMIRYLIRVL